MMTARIAPDDCAHQADAAAANTEVSTFALRRDRLR
jgi:hypothetical protein